MPEIPMKPLRKGYEDAKGRECSKCGVDKAWNKFSKDSRNARSRRSQCKSCELAQQQTRYTRLTPEQKAQRNARSRETFWRQNGLLLAGRPPTYADYRRLFEQQGGMCAIDICRTPLKPNDNQTHLDHDHETGEVRGILCGRHNRQAGTLEEALAMARYMGKHARKLKQ